MNRTDERKFWAIDAQEVVRLVGADATAGLTTAEAALRIATYGRNTFEVEKGSGLLGSIARQLASPLILVLIVACVVTVLTGHYRDAIFILIAIVVNAALGFWQENKAERALAELKTYLKDRARVVRDGVEREIDAEELVPGDLIRLSQGDRVAADARVIFANDFQADESVLTGESLPVAKSELAVAEQVGIADQTSMVFAGTLVTQGVATAVVCRTDDSTELGKIASLLAASEGEKTPLQRSIDQFSVRLSALLVVLTLLVFWVGVSSGQPFLDMFLTSVAVAVSAIPEGLPIAMTVILAVGVERMARRKGVVRRLIAAEALGSATVILTDKTGTLTEAKMVLSGIESRTRADARILSLALKNASVLVENPDDQPEEWRLSGKIMEVALVRAAALRGMPLREISDKSDVIESLPFNAVNKYSASLVKDGDAELLVFFGAPDVLIAHSALDEKEKRALLDRMEGLAGSGERVLGVATRAVHDRAGIVPLKDHKPSHLSFEALLTFRDPVRPAVRHAIERVSKAGIRTIIMTGDHRGTAVAVAQELGMQVAEGAVIDAQELHALSDEVLVQRLSRVRVIARVTPEDKLRIARLYQTMGEVVAMTGDGVNDAPAIKQANIGIAMGSGTEVARNVADLVLLDDNFETIVAAVEEGRQILSNIRKVLTYLLSNVADGLILIGGSIVAGVPLPLNALQILWVNFFSDSFPAVAFAFEKEGGFVQRATGKHAALFSPIVLFLILVIGTLTSALLFVIYMILLSLGFDDTLVRTFIFAAFGTYTLFLALSVRSLDQSLFSYALWSNHYLTGGIVLGLGLMAAAVYVPILQTLFDTVALPPLWLAGVIGVGILNIALVEIAKFFFRGRSRAY